jgi:hypothetical protein
MTKEELKTTGEALVALSEGKAVQIKSRYGRPSEPGWKDYQGPPDDPSPSPDYSSWLWRIKPQKQRRLIKREEMPADFWIRMKDFGGLWKRPTSISCMDRSDGGWAIGYLTDETSPTQQWIQVKQWPERKDTDPDIWEWSPDRKTVHSFYVEE